MTKFFAREIAFKPTAIERRNKRRITRRRASDDAIAGFLIGRGDVPDEAKKDIAEQVRVHSSRLNSTPNR